MLILNDKIKENLEITNALKHALKYNKFHLVYQPQYNYKQKKIIDYEALIRWENKKFSNIGPNVFIPNVQLLNDDFVDNVKKIVQEMDVDTKYIEFEVTESVLIESFDFIANQLSKLNRNFYCT